MDWQRTSLLAAIGIVIALLVNQWGDHQKSNAPVAVPQQTLSSSTVNSIPSYQAAADDSALGDIPTAIEDAREEQTIKTADGTAPLIEVNTDTLNVLIDTLGGDIVKVSLNDHLEQLDNPDEPLVILNRTQNILYIAQSGLIGQNGTDTAKGRPIFNATQHQYQMTDGQESLSVDLTYRQNSVDIIKRFTFNRGDNLVEVEYLINNQSNQAWKAGIYAQIKRDSHNPVTVDGFGMQPYLGAALTTVEDKYKKIDFADMDDFGRKGFKSDIDGGWVAMVQHYFISAWVPDQELYNKFSIRQSGNYYLMGFTSPQQTVAAGEQGVIKASFYAGPKDVKRLEEISEFLDLTVDYGWLWFIAKPLFAVLDIIYGFVGSWGLSIVLLTLLIKLVFFQLSATSYRSMAKMRKFGPEMARLKEIYGEDRQKMSSELMKLYKKEKINPLSGCLPILVQMPVFISLYWVLMESVELRHTPFLWLADLSIKDPYFVLPIVMGITMFIQQKLNPTPPDPLQARIMQMMPIVFTLLFMWFPAGLVVYWVVNNTLSIAQQYVITKQIENS